MIRGRFADAPSHSEIVNWGPVFDERFHLSVPTRGANVELRSTSSATTTVVEGNRPRTYPWNSAANAFAWNEEYLREKSVEGMHQARDGQRPSTT